MVAASGSTDSVFRREAYTGRGMRFWPPPRYGPNQHIRYFKQRDDTSAQEHGQ